MEIGNLARVVLWLSFVLFVGLVEMTLFENTKRISKERDQNIFRKSLQSNRRQNNLPKHFKEYSTRDKHSFQSMNSNKRDGFESSDEKEIDFTHKVIARSFPTGGKSRVRSLQVKQADQNDPYQRRGTIFDQVNTPKRHERWDAYSSLEIEDGLIKRSRNRVRLKSQSSHLQKTESHQNGFSAKQNISKSSANDTVPMHIKRQRISEGITNSDPFNGDGNNQGVADEGMRLAENPDSFFANPEAANPGVRALKAAHFYARPVHKFLPAEHRYSSSPIHRYLSSPVIFKGVSSDSNALVGGGQNLGISREIKEHFGGELQEPQPFSQGPTHHGQHVVVVNGPVSPFPVPAPGSPKVVLVHHPVPLPPQRVPIPFMVNGPMPPPFVIVHHKELLRPGELELR